MIFETLVVGPLGVNCFILGCEETKEGVVVDPGAEPEKVKAAITRLGLRITCVINTHGHFDHVGGNRKVLEETGAQFLIHQEDVQFLSRAADIAARYGVTTENSPPPDRLLEEGMILSFGNCQIEVLHTPGHTPGGCCLYLAGEELVITAEDIARWVVDFREVADAIRYSMRTGRWPHHTRSCWDWGHACEYLPICRCGDRVDACGVVYEQIESEHPELAEVATE